MPYVQGDPFEAETIDQAREAISDGIDAAMEREPEVAGEWLNLVDRMAERAEAMGITWTPAHTEGAIFTLTGAVEAVGGWYAHRPSGMPELTGPVLGAFVDLMVTGAENAVLLERRLL